MRICKFIAVLGLVTSLLGSGGVALAQASTVTKAINDCALKVKSDGSTLNALQPSKVSDDAMQLFYPTGSLQTISSVCRFEFSGENSYNKTVEVQITHSKTSYRPRIYTWSEDKSKWTPVLTEMNRTNSVTTADIPTVNQVIAVMVEPVESYQGTGSWYKDSRHPNGAATDRYPVGTKLKVTNLGNNKSVVVTITSTWDNPDKSRVIDLVSPSFKKIASLSTGLAQVKIERLAPAPDKNI